MAESRKYAVQRLIKDFWSGDLNYTQFRAGLLAVGVADRAAGIGIVHDVIIAKRVDSMNVADAFAHLLPGGN